MRVKARRSEEQEIDRLRAVVRSLQSRLKQLESSLHAAWTMPMSEVVKLKTSVEKEGKEVRKKIASSLDEISRLERIAEDS